MFLLMNKESEKNLSKNFEIPIDILGIVVYYSFQDKPTN